MSSLKDRRYHLVKRKTTLEKAMLREEKDVDFTVPSLTAKEVFKDKPLFFTN